MRFRYLHIAGFRGVKDPIEILFPSGFTVISGRNGTGKSSICDAIEYALTGSITKYSQSSEKGEDVADYMWWRGSQPAEKKYVTLALVDSGGTTITITRRPDGVVISNEGDLRAALCDVNVDSDKTLSDICRTSIIRDELITQLSVDLAEVERFNFVRAAVGSASFAASETKLSNAHRVLGERISRTKQEYERARDRVKDLLTELSKAQAEATRTEDVATAEKALRALIQRPQGDFAELLVSGRKIAPELRLKIDGLTRLAARIEALKKRESELAGPTLRERQTQLTTAVEQQAASLVLIQKEVADVEVLLREQQEKDLLSSSLAQLHEHGSRVGLQDGHCPLCGSDITDNNYRNHLSELAIAIGKIAETTTNLVRRRAALSDAEKRANADLSAARRESDQLSMALESLNSERDSILKELRRYGVDMESFAEDTQALLTKTMEGQRLELMTVEKSMAVLEGSKTHARIAEFQKELANLQQVVVAAERRVAKQETADQRIKQATATLKRISSEIVDDRLAAIRPLLAELYVRLRPHVDWPEISYLIRGDTRRFLSLRVGDGLNLRFMFSSGQRRAAGLAFLMAVSLSRPWCLLESLIFDDPVQHIDDFRALHLVESLSALRQVGRQVICTVEDSALAELLARRLRSSVVDEGAMIEMDYESGRGVFIGKALEIHPFPKQVLKSA